MRCYSTRLINVQLDRGHASSETPAISVAPSPDDRPHYALQGSNYTSLHHARKEGSTARLNYSFTLYPHSLNRLSPLACQKKHLLCSSSPTNRGIRLCWPTALDTRTSSSKQRHAASTRLPQTNTTSPFDLHRFIRYLIDEISPSNTHFLPTTSHNNTPQPHHHHHGRPTQPHRLPLHRPLPNNNPRPRRRNAQLPTSPPAKEPRPTPSPQLGLLARPSRPRPSPPIALCHQRSHLQHSLRRAPRAPRPSQRHPLLLEPLQQLRHHPPPPPRQRAPLQARRQTHLGRPTERLRRLLDFPRAQATRARILEGSLHARDRGAITSGCRRRGCYYV